MKSALKILFVMALAVMPLQPYFATTTPLVRLAWHDMGAGFIVIAALFFLYTIFSNIDLRDLRTVRIFFILSFLLLVTAATGVMQPINASELLRLLAIFLLIPFVEYLLRINGWRLIACIALGILVMHAQWGIAQYIVQQDLGLHILGETRFSQEATAGIANFNLDKNTKSIRAYGPYSHPNSLAGSLVIAMLFIILLTLNSSIRNTTYNSTTRAIRNNDKLTSIVKALRSSQITLVILSLLFIILLGILVSFSRAAVLSIIMCALIMFVYRRTLPRRILRITALVIGITALVFAPLYVKRSTDNFDVAIPERVSGYRWAIDILKDDYGISFAGPGQYTKALKIHLDNKNVSYEHWQIAPVHSTPLLFVSEWGVIATVILFISLVIAFSKYSFHKIKTYLVWVSPLVPILLFDHYFLTQTAPQVWLLLLLMTFRQAILDTPAPGSKIPSAD